mmetsp:Transcript_9070/g.13736  ORF Transcript_9070/g.13736 Transcript_9070/m.13736 type:complete len:300 (+) Transcript_9070:1382-2281(+)
MERVIPTHTVLLSGKKTIRLNHDKRVTCLHGENKVMVILRPANISKLNCRLNHSTRSISIKGKNTRRKRSMISSNTHSTVQLFTLFHKRKHRFEKVFSLLYIICLTLINMIFKILSSICKVSRVNSDLLNSICHHESNLGLEVHICTKRDIISLLEQTFTNLHGSICLTLSLNSDSDEIKSFISTSHDLINGRFDIGGVGGSHCLAYNWVFGSEFDGSAFDSACRSAHDGVKVCAIFLDGSEDFIACSRLDGVCPVYISVGGRVVGHVKGRYRWYLSHRSRERLNIFSGEEGNCCHSER